MTTEDKLKRILMELSAMIGHSNDYSPLASQIGNLVFYTNQVLLPMDVPDWSMVENWDPDRETFQHLVERQQAEMRERVNDRLAEGFRRLSEGMKRDGE